MLDRHHPRRFCNTAIESAGADRDCDVWLLCWGQILALTSGGCKKLRTLAMLSVYVLCFLSPTFVRKKCNAKLSQFLPCTLPKPVLAAVVYFCSASAIFFYRNAS